MKDKEPVQWTPLPRRGVDRWAGSGEAAKWRICVGGSKYYLWEALWVQGRLPLAYGPFDTFEAARAAFEVLKGG